MNQNADKRQAQAKLWKLTYSDINAGVRLTTYADTIVYDGDGIKKTLLAVRFGGYAEQVRGMADAIYGGGSVYLEADNETVNFQSLTKQYRRMLSNDGIYTEATLLVEDDPLKNEETENETENVADQCKSAARTSYIFCQQNDLDHLFEEIDKKIAVPMIPEFRDYVISELQKHNILKKLTVISHKEKFDAWKIMLNNDEKNVIEVIEKGLKSGEISIPGSSTENPFESINSVSKYLNAFGITVAEKIKDLFNPLFDPSTDKLSKEVLTVNSYIRKKAGYYLYDAQLAVAEALKRRIDKSKFGLCIAECGSGKTKIGVAALHAHHMGKNKSKTFNIVLCPSHLSKKWVREVEESIPNTFACHIKSIKELNKVYEAYKNGQRSCYVVITKEKARDGYMKRPAAKWNRRQRAFLCPYCYKPIMMEVVDDGSKYKVEADQFFFQKENKKNHQCENCGSPLWAMLVPDQQSDWVKISNYGFIHRKMASVHFEALHAKVILAHSKREKKIRPENGTENEGKREDEDVLLERMICAAPDDDDNLTGKDGQIIEFPKSYYDIKAVVNDPDGIYHAAGAYSRFPLSTYISWKMRGKIDGLIVDEIQDYNNNSGQGDAMNELLGCAKKAIGLTGTLINGYSQGIFYLLYRIAPYLMQIDDKKYTGTKEFNDEYGVTESVFEISEPEYNSNRRTVRKKLRERQLPGVSPLVYSRFLIESSVFLSLNDMGKQLPEYEEIPVELSMRPEIALEYKKLEGEFIEVLKHEKRIAQKVMSAFMSLLTVYPDQPYDMKPIINPITGATITKPQDKSGFDALNEKDEWLLEKVKEKILQGGRVIVYTSWIRIDTQKKLLKLFKENSIKAEVLNASVAPNRREEWVIKRVNSGIQVLITNPALVETGLDLNDFTTLVYYNIGYKLFTLRQSSRRSWRINQRAPRIEVYFLYFKDVMQYRAIRLMASKLAVAGILEGNLTDEGLAAMSECQDLTTLLAQELTQGIKNEVEDLSAVFKKMAILKPEMETLAVEGEIPDAHQDQIYDHTYQMIQSHITAANEVSSNRELDYTSEIESIFLSAIQNSKPISKSTNKKKAVYTDPDQISIFDYGFDVASA